MKYSVIKKCAIKEQNGLEGTNNGLKEKAKWKKPIEKATYGMIPRIWHSRRKQSYGDSKKTTVGGMG